MNNAEKKIYAHQYYLEHKEILQEQHRSWRSENRERNAENNRAYHALYRDRVREQSRLWRLRNKDHIKLCRSIYLQTENARASDKRHQAKRRAFISALCTLTSEQWREILEYFNYCCAYCHKQGKLTMDHIVPLNAGGNHVMDNIVPACQTCNSKKHTKSLIEFQQRMGSNP